MKTIRRFIVSVIVFCMIFTVCQAFAASPETIDLRFDGTRNYTMAYEVLERVNSERKDNGLPALAMDVDLLDVGMHRAEEIAIYYSHDRPNGESCFTAFPERFDYSALGENIAIGQRSSGEVMNSWMNSPGHRANILSTDYKSIGIGCFYQDSVIHWVQVFSSETASVPSPTPVNKKVTAEVMVASDYCDLYIDTVETETENVYQARMINVNPEFEYSYIVLKNDDFTYSSTETSIAQISEKGLLPEPERQGFIEISVYINGDTLIYRDILVSSDHEFRTGDVNSDDEIDNSDLILVARHVVNIPVNIDLLAADVNFDNQVTNVDLILIARHIVGLTDQ